ncbi:hypothetical protein JHK87_010397 [Glycine soja]|nr:hypothetical protein JHK87_010397 [Glycine soja]
MVDGPISESHAASLMKNLLEAIAHCHRLSPDNIVFDSANNLNLIDFDLVEWFRDGKSMSNVVGTPYYVTPEVLLGREYDEKVDVWSYGVILYIMLAVIPLFYRDYAA